jgi:hypothetical protein
MLAQDESHIFGKARCCNYKLSFFGNFERRPAAFSTFVNTIHENIWFVSWFNHFSDILMLDKEDRSLVGLSGNDSAKGAIAIICDNQQT